MKENGGAVLIFCALSYFLFVFGNLVVNSWFCEFWLLVFTVFSFGCQFL
jgi:hypothetical protein